MNKRNLKLNSISFNLTDIFAFIKVYSGLIMLFSLFVCGLIFGTVIVKNSEYCRFILTVFSADGNDFFRTFVNSSFDVIFVLTINFIMGLCLIGTPFIGFMSILRGIGFGGLYSFRLFNSGFENIGQYLVTDVLFFVLFYVIFILSQYNAMCMSESLKLCFCRNKSEISLKEYLLKNAIYFTASFILLTIQSIIKTIIQ